MTYLEKYMQEHPADDVSFTVNNACPGYGYWATSPKCLRHRTVGPTEFACMTCWNQEIPGTEKTEEPIAEVTDVNEKNGGVTVTVEPIIKDSGDRTEFATGAVRDMREGKGRCDLMPLDVVAAFIAVYENTADPVLMDIYMFQKNNTASYLYCALNEFCREAYLGNEKTMFLEVAKHFEEGAKKYGENNWQKGIPTWCYIDSAVRHYLKWRRGDKDEPHDRAFVWNLLCCIWTIEHEAELKTAQ